MAMKEKKALDELRFAKKTNAEIDKTTSLDDGNRVQRKRNQRREY